MHDIAGECRNYQGKRQPALPPLVEDDQEYADIDRDEESAGEDAGSRAPVRGKRLHEGRQQQRCQQDQIFLLKKPCYPMVRPPCSIPGASSPRSKLGVQKTRLVSRMSNERPSSLDTLSTSLLFR